MYESSRHALLLLMVCALFFPSHAADIYVAKSNKKELYNCGSTEEDACPTIQAAVNYAKPNSYIRIKASESPYNECPIVVRKPFTFIGYGGTVVVDCETATKNAFEVDFSKSDKEVIDAAYVRIWMGNLRIRNAKTAVRFESVKKTTLFQVQNSVFQDNGADIEVMKSRQFKLALTNVTMMGNSGYGVHIDNTKQVKVDIVGTQLYGKHFRIVSTTESLEVKLDDTSFNMSSRTLKDEAAFHIETCFKKTAVNVQGSSFSNHVGKTRGCCYITSPYSTKPPVKGAPNVVLTFKEVTFSNNTAKDGSGGAFMLNTTLTKKNSPTGNVNFMNCEFSNNSAYYEGGALWLDGWNAKTVRFTGCVFQDNHAHGPERGQGGAIFSKAGQYILLESRFSRNSAAKSGGTLHFHKSTTKIRDCSFQNSAVSTNDIQGDVLFMTNGIVFFYGKVIFDLQSANFQKSIIWFQGAGALLHMSNFTKFSCPNGYNYEEMEDIIKVRPLDYGFFGFRCVACHDLFYTASRGYHQMNGSSHVAKCHKCPYGALCNGTIRARANFWGKPQGDVVQMYPCPAGYCCNKEPCPSYDTCQAHRTGTLCGRCEDGFSDRLSSVSCQPNKDCRDLNLILICFEVIAILIFLVFHQEIITKLTSIACPAQALPEQYRSREELEASTDEIPLQNGSSGIETNSLLNQNSVRCVYTSQPAPDHTSIERSASFNHTSAYIKVFFYFFQMLIFLRDSHSSIPNTMLEFVTPFINFQFSDTVSGCLFKDWSPVKKVLFKNTLCGWVFMSLLVFYLVYYVARRCVKRKYEQHRDALPAFRSRSFPVRLTGCVINVMLLSYLALIQLCASLLNCVHVGNKRVLYLDGTFSCYQPFQAFIWFYFVACLFCFPVVLVVGRKQLIQGKLSPQLFLLACFVPPVFLLQWPLHHYCAGKLGSYLTGDAQDVNNPHKEKILYILQHPYKEPQSREKMTWREHMAENWECVLITRRLLIVTLSIFVKSYLKRAYLIFSLSLGIMMHHVWVQPFLNSTANVLEMISLGLIVLFSGFDIAQASFAMSATVVPTQVASIQKGRDIFLMFLLFSAVLWFPSVLIYRRCCIRPQTTTHNTEVSEDNVNCTL